MTVEEVEVKSKKACIRLVAGFYLIIQPHRIFLQKPNAYNSGHEMIRHILDYVDKNYKLTENIDMSVTDTAVAQINKGAESPIIKHYVWQAIVAVNKRVRPQRALALVKYLHSFLSASVTEAVRKM